MSKPQEERTLVLIKPDGVKRGLIGEIINRFERRGLKIIALKMVHVTAEQVDNHYPKSNEWIARLGEKSLKTYKKYGWDPIKEMDTDDPKEIGMQVREWIIDYMTAAPLVKAIVQGIHAIDMVRKIAGDTIPAFADMGTIRGDFSIDSAALANKEKRAIFNIVHASETQEEAEHEINLWFSPDEICPYKRSDDDVMFVSLK